MNLSMIIYVVMVLLVVPAFYWRGSGLLPLVRASGQLKRASRYLEDRDQAETLRGRILKSGAAFGGGSAELPEDLLGLTDSVLRSQLARYRSDVRRMSLKTDSKSQCDIRDYFDDVTIEQIGNTSFIDHVSSALTGLGLLGTFIGMTSGLTGFDTNTSASALVSISTLLDGMKYAFITSICGLGLSLLLGILMRTFRRSAEENLDHFVCSFQTNVLCNQQEAVYNQLLDGLHSIANQLSRKHNDDMRNMEVILQAFVEQLATRLQLQVQDMQNAMASIAKQQEQYSATVAALNSQLSAATREVASVSSAFCAIAAQGRQLEEQIQAASKALHSSVDDLQSMVKIDAEVLQKHHDLASKLQESAGELTSLSTVLNDQAGNTAGVIQQLAGFTATAVDETAAACSNLVQKHSEELKSRMESMLTAAAVQNEQIRVEGEKQMEQIRLAGSEAMVGIREDNDKTMKNLQTGAERILRDMPQTVAVRRELDELIRQNEKLIENQIMIQQDIKRRDRLFARLMNLWRNKE